MRVNIWFYSEWFKKRIFTRMRLGKGKVKGWLGDGCVCVCVCVCVCSWVCVCMSFIYIILLCFIGVCVCVCVYPSLYSIHNMTISELISE